MCVCVCITHPRPDNIQRKPSVRFTRFTWPCKNNAMLSMTNIHKLSRPGSKHGSETRSFSPNAFAGHRWFYATGLQLHITAANNSWCRGRRIWHLQILSNTAARSQSCPSGALDGKVKICKYIYPNQVCIHYGGSGRECQCSVSGTVQVPVPRLSAPAGWGGIV